MTRRRDPDAARRDLLDAALAEFAAKGRAGARVAEIAARAGVSKQLVSHHFGGKDGLYRALLDEWSSEEADFAAAGLPLADVVAGYARAAAQHPQLTRLFLREALDGLADQGAGPGPEEVEDLRRRQVAGEVAPDLDPELLLLVLQAAASALAAFPADARRLTGLDPGDPVLTERHEVLLRALVQRLAG